MYTALLSLVVLGVECITSNYGVHALFTALKEFFRCLIFETVNYGCNVRIMEEIEEIWDLESLDIYYLAAVYCDSRCSFIFQVSNYGIRISTPGKDGVTTNILRKEWPRHLNIVPTLPRPGLASYPFPDVSLVAIPKPGKRD